MSQNMSSRKQELLSRLRNTLAIVSQATGFNDMDDDRSIMESRTSDRRSLEQMTSSVSSNPLDPRLARSRALPTGPSPNSYDHSLDVYHQDERNPSRSSERWYDDPELDKIYQQGRPVTGERRVAPPVTNIEDIDDEDEFLYGKKDEPQKTQMLAHSRPGSQWPVSNYQSENQQYSSRLSQSTDDPYDCLHTGGNFSNSSRPSNASIRSHPLPNHQMPVSRFLGQQDISYSPDLTQSNQQNFPTSLSGIAMSNTSDTSGSLLGGVSTDMLQNILKFVSSQKSQQPTMPSYQQRSSSHSVGDPLSDDKWTKQQPHHSAQQLAGQLAKECNEPKFMMNQITSLCRNLQSTGVVSYLQQTHVGESLSSYGDVDIPSKYSVSSELLSGKKFNQNAGMDEPVNISKPVRATGCSVPAESTSVEPKVSTLFQHESSSAMSVGTKPSQMLFASNFSAIPDMKQSGSNRGGSGEGSIGNDTLDKLISMLGCNSNVLELMQKLVKKDDIERSIKDVKPSAVKGLKDGSANISSMRQSELGPEAVITGNTVSNEDTVPLVTSTGQPSSSPVDTKSPLPHAVVTVKEDGGIGEVASGIPVLCRPQKNYDSDDDKPDPTYPDIVSSTSQSIQKRDSEWEKSTEEFLRRLQSKTVVAGKTPSTVPSVNKETAQTRQLSSEERVLSPDKSPKERSRSPNVLSERPNSPVKQSFGVSQRKQISEIPQFSDSAGKKSGCEEKEATGNSSYRLVGAVEKANDGCMKGSSAVVNKNVADAKSVDRTPTLKLVQSDDKAKMIKAKNELTTYVKMLQDERHKLLDRKNQLKNQHDAEEVNENAEVIDQHVAELDQHITSLTKAVEELACQIDGTVTADKVNHEATKKPASSRKSRHRSSSSSSSSLSSFSFSSNDSRSRSRDRTRTRRRSRSSSRHRWVRGRNQDREQRARGNNRRWQQQSGGRDDKTRRIDERDRLANKLAPQPRPDVKKVPLKAEIDGRMESKTTSAVLPKPESLKTGLQSASANTTNLSSGPALGKNTVSPTVANAGVQPVVKTAAQLSIKPGRAVENADTMIQTVAGTLVETMAKPLHRADLAAQAPAQPATANSEIFSSLAFSTDKVITSLQEMVRMAEIAETSKDKSETNQKDMQTSALELAISMYLVANEFYDGGSLWCRSCDCIFGDIASLCRHLHSDQHQLKLDPNYSKPQPSGAHHQPSCAEGSLVAPARGDEFLLPIQAFFCSLCCEYSKDSATAEGHLKSKEHNMKFKKFLKENPSYEMHYLRGKMVAVQKRLETPSSFEKQQTSIAPEKTKQVQPQQQDSASNLPTNEVQSQPGKVQVKLKPLETSVGVQQNTDAARQVAPPTKTIASSKLNNDAQEVAKCKVEKPDGVVESLKVANKKPLRDQKASEAKQCSDDDIIVVKESNVRKTFEKPARRKRDRSRSRSSSSSSSTSRSSSRSRSRSSERYRSRRRMKLTHRNDWRRDENRSSSRKSSTAKSRDSSIRSREELNKKPPSSKTENNSKSGTSLTSDKLGSSVAGKVPQTSKQTNAQRASEIPLPGESVQPPARVIQPFTVARSSKLAKQPAKTSATSSEARLPPKFDVQDFQVLDECGDA